MAVPILYILLLLGAGHSLKNLLRKWGNVKDFQTELSEVLITVAEARRDGKITKEEQRQIFKEMKDAAKAWFIDKIGG